MPDWNARMASAIAIAEQYSSYSQLADGYKRLFQELWEAEDLRREGVISADGAARFAEKMVAAGWGDWAVTARDREMWEAMERAGGVGLEDFAQMSEDDDFQPRLKGGKGGGKFLKPGPGARSKAQAGAGMAASHASRMANFKLPEGTTPGWSPRANGHCEACQMQPMLQHVYAGSCRFCQGPAPPRDLLDYMCMCEGCATQMGRCCGCGKTVV